MLYCRRFYFVAILPFFYSSPILSVSDTSRIIQKHKKPCAYAQGSCYYIPAKIKQLVRLQT